VTRADYVGPEACGDCHAEKQDSWKQTLHASMNQIAGDESVIGDFDAELSYRGTNVRFAMDSGAYVMVIDGVRWRVTRTIGTRYLQEYVGVGDDGVEMRLPFGWWVKRKGWYPSAFFDSWMTGEEKIEPEEWAGRCAWCHNTYAFERRLGREVGHGLEQFVEGGRPAERVDDVVTVGISCESCHLGGREHVENERAISFVPRGEGLTLTSVFAGKKDPRLVAGVCGQCHSTPAPRFPDGGAVRNSSEALDLAAGPCTGIKCTDCHDPHEGGVKAVACGKCHAMAKDHSRHEGVACEDCHMPKIVQGISSFVRTHRIASPTDEDMIAIAGPNACGLCHLDQGIGWVSREIEAGWGRRIEGDWLAAYGTYDRPLGEVWLDGESRTLRILAAAAYARRGDRRDLPALMRHLDEPRPFYRMWMLFAIEDLGGPIDVDPLRP
jgi:hypothetical protein